MNAPKTIDEGVALLDRYFGSRAWVLKVKPEEIAMNDTRSCVLGQIFGDYITGHRSLNLADEGESDSHHHVFAHDNFNPLKNPKHQWEDYFFGNKLEISDITKEDIEKMHGKKYLLTFDDGKSMVVDSLKDAPKGLMFIYTEI